eukprot:TRINITY_DN23659_c0_g1_i1.p1 TRINITY_DN23659_c0_g1~~TRINITY_DN23659_c0_g1_i1.p1  ORF type:complete len:397 (+),score=106.56 TRINITY_DN23659_c0_g1_i1:217-1407(+)
MSGACKRQRHAGETEACGATERVVTLDLYALFKRVPKDLGVNMEVLRYLHGQALAATCRAALDWLSPGGRRVVFCVNDEGRGVKGPFAIPERLSASHVETVRLGRYGRNSVKDCAELVASCSRAVTLRCVYAKLTDFGGALNECLNCLSAGAQTLRLPRLQNLRFHQCRLAPADLVQLLRLMNGLRHLDLCGEALGGVAMELQKLAPIEKLKELETVVFNDCRLQADDVAAFLQTVGCEGLKILDLQGNNLRGLRLPPLPALDVLRLVDCNLLREDAMALLASCPSLRRLSLCGNPLSAGTSAAADSLAANGASDDEGSDSGRSDASSTAWPPMPKLEEADFRACGLGAEEECALLNRSPAGVKLLVRSVAAGAAAAPNGQGSHHVVFPSSSEDEG